MAGSPKRFARAIGVPFSLSAAVRALGFDRMTAAEIVLTLRSAAAMLQSVLGLCLGWRAVVVLMKLGVVPDEVCLRCADISAALH